VVNVIWHKSTSIPLHSVYQNMDGSIVFARWRQCAPYVTHAYLGPPESKSQTAPRSVQPLLHSSQQTVPILHNGPLPPKNCLFPWGCGPCSCIVHCSLDPAESRTQTASRSVQLFLQGSWQSVPLPCNGCPFIQNCPFLWG